MGIYKALEAAVSTADMFFPSLSSEQQEAFYITETSVLPKAGGQDSCWMGLNTCVCNERDLRVAFFFLTMLSFLCFCIKFMILRCLFLKFLESELWMQLSQFLCCEGCTSITPYPEISVFPPGPVK